MYNGTYAVTISGSAGKAQFSGGRFAARSMNYIFRVFQRLTRGRVAESPIPQPQRTTINGMPAAIHDRARRHASGVIDVSVVAYQWDPQRIYHFVMMTPGGSGVGPFTPMVNSLRRIYRAEAAAIRPRIIHVVTVAPGDTVQSLASRMAYRDFQAGPFSGAEWPGGRTAGWSPDRRSNWSFTARGGADQPDRVERSTLVSSWSTCRRRLRQAPEVRPSSRRR